MLQVTLNAFFDCLDLSDVRVLCLSCKRADYAPMGLWAISSTIVMDTNLCVLILCKVLDISEEDFERVWVCMMLLGVLMLR